MVTTFMGNDPNTSQDTTLDVPIDGPGQVVQRLREELNVISGNIVEESCNGEIIHNIREGAKHRTLEAMGWDGFLDLAKSERWLCIR